jgi:hypothetical protein
VVRTLFFIEVARGRKAFHIRGGMFIPSRKVRGFVEVLSAYKMKFRTILKGI